MTKAVTVTARVYSQSQEQRHLQACISLSTLGDETLLVAIRSGVGLLNNLMTGIIQLLSHVWKATPMMVFTADKRCLLPSSSPSKRVEVGRDGEVGGLSMSAFA